MKYPNRVHEYRHLLPSDLVPPSQPGVFFDPADTEAGIWATFDLLEPGITVLDLGSGSGAAAAAVARAGAGRVHGLDISPASVEWAGRHHARERVSFSIGDYTSCSTAELLAQCPFDGPPGIVVSNPPYVPMAPADGKKTSIDGGPDGLQLVRKVVDHAARLGSGLSLTIGSYSSPRIAAELLNEAGFQIVSVTLGALRLGAATLENIDRVLELEAEGECALLRAGDGFVYYLILGLSCSRTAEAGAAPAELMDLLKRACTSKTLEVETLDRLPEGWEVPVRLLILPDEPDRRHF